MTFLTRLNRPWLHFIILGSVLYYLQGVYFPEPKPVVGPLNEARLEALQQQWFSTTGRPATDDQLQRMTNAELDRDMLFHRAIDLELHLYDTVVYQRLLRNMRFLKLGEGNEAQAAKTDQELYEQALDMRLHLGDEVVKRRMIQVMEQILLLGNPPKAATQGQLDAEFAERKQELRRPPRYSIEHLYFDRNREADIPDVIATIEAEKLSATDARRLSSPFLPGYQFRRQTPDQLARHFGASFVKNLQATNPEPGTWVGPVRSTYGMHYVWVSEVEDERDATLEEVQLQLTRDIDARSKAAALKESLDKLRQRYEVRS